MRQGPTQDEGLPPFPGDPLRDVPVPSAYLLGDDEFGTAVLSEYSNRVRSDFHDNPVLKVIKMAGGVVHGSNPFVVCLVDMIVRPRYRVATPVDLQTILASRGKSAFREKMRGGYKDAALVLRSVREPNVYIAQKLAGQLDPKMEWPVCIFLSGLEIANDKESPPGLVFKFTRNTRAFPAPVLESPSGHFDNASVDPTTGLPKAISGAGRYFYSMPEGLARLYLGRGSSLDTIWDELPNSQADGRIVIVDNVARSEIVADYIRRLDKATGVLEG
jgi:hypothetical protein